MSNQRGDILKRREEDSISVRNMVTAVKGSE